MKEFHTQFNTFVYSQIIDRLSHVPERIMVIVASPFKDLRCGTVSLLSCVTKHHRRWLCSQTDWRRFYLLC